MAKDSFDQVIREHTPWVLRYIRSKLTNQDLAEDLLQEVFIKAFRYYDAYEESGRLKPWLMRITQNTVKSYFSSKENKEDFNLSIDGVDYDSEVSFYELLVDTDSSPEKLVEEQDMVRSIITLVNKLTLVEKQIFNYRIIEGRSVSEVASLTGLAQGTVKSKTHYVLQKIRKGINPIPVQEIQSKGEKKMACKQMYVRLFKYAKGVASQEEVQQVEKHIAVCEECKKIGIGLRELLGQLKFNQNDAISHFTIEFPEKNITIGGIGISVNKMGWNTSVEKINKELEEWGGHIPKGENLFYGFGHNEAMTQIGAFDNEGNDIGFKEVRDANRKGLKVVEHTFMKKIYDHMWFYTVLEGCVGAKIETCTDEPNKYHGHGRNNGGNDARSGIYQAVPYDAEDICIKRGNGVIDAKTYHFAYVDRYVTAEELLVLDYYYYKK